MSDLFDDLLKAADPESSLWKQPPQALPGYASDPVKIIGLVAESSGGGSFDASGHLIRHITLAAWRAENGSIKEKSLDAFERTAEHIDDDRTGQSGSLSQRAYAIIRFPARLNGEASRAVVLGPIVETVDEGLDAIGRRLQRTVTFNDEILGTLRLDRSLDWFESQREWRGVVVDVHINAVDDAPNLDELSLAHRFFADEAKWAALVDETCVADLFDLANDWKMDGEDADGENFVEWTKEDFLDRMSPESVSFHDGEEVSVFHRDGDLFWGHSIIFESKADGSDASAHMAG